MLSIKTKNGNIWKFSPKTGGGYPILISLFQLYSPIKDVKEGKIPERGVSQLEQIPRGDPMALIVIIIFSVL